MEYRLPRPPPVAAASTGAGSLPLRLPQGSSPSWVLAETVVATGFAMLFMLLVGREIGPQAMGLATMALAAFLLLDLLTASVFTDALVQFPKLGRNHASSAAGAGVLAGTT